MRRRGMIITKRSICFTASMPTRRWLHFLSIRTITTMYLAALHSHQIQARMTAAAGIPARAVSAVAAMAGGAAFKMVSLAAIPARATAAIPARAIAGIPARATAAQAMAGGAAFKTVSLAAIPARTTAAIPAAAIPARAIRALAIAVPEIIGGSLAAMAETAAREMKRTKQMLTPMASPMIQTTVRTFTTQSKRTPTVMVSGMFVMTRSSPA